ncbi:FAD:protein FMN transferase [Asticcacaulis sp. EMRT-3]|uniref:FAD:protein FMN transferase n=1 Tax=Asticcacaulis sp. EMRT-3 TaxID=3040349 RepID=UPI0024AED1CD|nr:FAD:protein FMN transferase [Asticcacaulis sp. EMRT-3]MDI7776262.1 FAD:protein FMN transferase [Asticcacaulis sp. EMRT-3]
METAESLECLEDGFVYHFNAMHSPCEVRIETDDAWLAEQAGRVVEIEAQRIERTYSRYRDDSVIGCINGAAGKPVRVDRETCALLDFADRAWRLSGGRFDITSGVLRRVWRFDGSDQVPSRAQIAAVRPLIGWGKVRWQDEEITLAEGQEIDFGGFGKEYAVDCAINALRRQMRAACLVNFGGDLRVTGPRKDGQRWRIGIEDAIQPGVMAGRLEISDGALTTSGDARRFLLRDGVRYSHILDPRTAMPVRDPPRSVTVAAPTCIEAGFCPPWPCFMVAGRKNFLKKKAYVHGAFVNPYLSDIGRADHISAFTEPGRSAFRPYDGHS